MSIDINKIKGKLKDLQKNNGGSNRSLYWKPEEGKQIVRIVPYAENPANPFIEMYFHYNFGGEHLVSPISYEDEDPIHEWGKKLRQQGDDDSYEQSRRFMPKLRTHVPVIVRGEEDAGIRYWGFGKQVYEQLLGYIADPDYGDITDPKTGRDIKVEYEKPEKGFPKTTIRVKPNQTKALDDLNDLKEQIKEQPPLSKLNQPLSYAELEKKLKDYINATDENTSSDASQSQNNNKNDSDDEDAPWSESNNEGDSDVESAFDELFED